MKYNTLTCLLLMRRDWSWPGPLGHLLAGRHRSPGPPGIVSGWHSSPELGTFHPKADSSSGRWSGSCKPLYRQVWTLRTDHLILKQKHEKAIKSYTMSKLQANIVHVYEWNICMQTYTSSRSKHCALVWEVLRGSSHSKPSVHASLIDIKLLFLRWTEFCIILFLTGLILWLNYLKVYKHFYFTCNSLIHR